MRICKREWAVQTCADVIQNNQVECNITPFRTIQLLDEGMWIGWLKYYHRQSSAVVRNINAQHVRGSSVLLQSLIIWRHDSHTKGRRRRRGSMFTVGLQRNQRVSCGHDSSAGPRELHRIWKQVPKHFTQLMFVGIAIKSIYFTNLIIIQMQSFACLSGL